jgi:Kef-type K+ transport system membrane component KefB/nucleotide-binding universal stress UspA family protein
MSDATDTERDDEARDEAAEENGGGEGGGETTDRFGGEGGKKVLLLGYVGMLAVVVLVLFGLIALGGDLKPPKAEEAGQKDPRSSINADKVLWKLLLAGILILMACRIAGGLLKKVHQPQVIGEIIAGVLLGPSLLGAVWPSAFDFVFPPELMSYLDVLAQIGLIFYMFLVGLELDFSLMRGRGHAAVWVSHASIIAPFLMGVALALWLFPTLGAGDDFLPFALFLGAAMSITAFPVLARILTDRGLYKTRIGTVALTVGAVDDVTAWCMLAVVITVARDTPIGQALLLIGILMVFIAFMLKAVRPVMARVSRYYERRGALSGTFLAALFIGLLASALITDKLKIHVIFGAFIFGAIMPHDSGFVRDLTGKLEDFSVVFLLPFFFTFSGIRTDIFAIGGDVKKWLMTLAILAVAILGKWGGSKLAARFVGLEWREAGALGVLVNCRGLTELIILNIGLQLGVLSPGIFAMLVIMAVVTTLMTEPALTIYYPRDVQRQMIKEETGEEPDIGGDDGEGRQKVLVAVGNSELARELTQVAAVVAGSAAPDGAGDGGDGEDAQDGAGEVTLLRVVKLSGTEVSHAPKVQDSMVDDAVDRVRPLRELVEDAGLSANPVAIPGGHVGETISRVANELDVDLVLMGYHQALFGHRLLGGAVGEVLRDARADVAVLVDPEGPRPLGLRDGGRILVPYAGSFHEQVGLDLALRLARTTGASITLLVSEEGEADDRATEAEEGTDFPFERVRVEGDVTEALFERAADFNLLVLGVGDRWMTQEETLASVREEVMEKTGTPYLLVRRFGGKRGRLRRRWAQLKRAPGVLADVYRSDGGEPTAGKAGEETRERLGSGSGGNGAGNGKGTGSDN